MLCIVVQGCSVTVNLADGKKLTGVLNTATPFEGKAHVIAVKAGRLLEVSWPKDTEAPL
jgi:hypothetical protein